MKATISEYHDFVSWVWVPKSEKARKDALKLIKAIQDGEKQRTKKLVEFSFKEKQ